MSISYIFITTEYFSQTFYLYMTMYIEYSLVVVDVVNDDIDVSKVDVLGVVTV